MESLSKKLFLVRWWIIVFFLMYPVGESLAQQELSSLKNMVAEDGSAVDALILYPESVRKNILEASKHPEGIVKLNSLQSQTSGEVTALLADLPRSEQEDFWNLARYEGLIDKLVEDGKKSKNEIQEILQSYPDEIHEKALDYGARRYDVLAAINKIHKSFNSSLEEMLSGYPAKTKEAFHQLIKLPEVLSILNDNIALVVLVGDAYKKYPDWINQKMDSLSLEAARQNAQELKDWSKSLEEDPEAVEEFKQSAKEYAEDYGYDEEDCCVPKDPDEVNIYYYYDPYPYWFGYPWWYPRYWWYPYPFWYHTGFYFGTGGIVIVGLPSWYFVTWHFHYPVHHYYYPHLSDLYVYHYRHSRVISSGVNRAVHTWEVENRDELPKDFFKPENRVERFREYGQFEDSYEKRNIYKAQEPVTRKEYYEKNVKRYPNLNYENIASKSNQIDKEKPYQRTYPEKEIEPKKTVPEKRNYDYAKPAPKETYPQRTLPQQRTYPERKLYPDKSAEPQKQAPQIKQYPQRPTQPQRKYYPEKPVAPKQQPAPIQQPKTETRPTQKAPVQKQPVPSQKPQINRDLQKKTLPPPKTGQKDLQKVPK